MTCGNCHYFTGEECNGYHEGKEAYSDDEACEDYKLEQEKD